MYIAHTREHSDEAQSLRQHSDNVAALARELSVEEFQALARATGTLHDLGKYQNAFQLYLLGKGGRTPHALCGAQEIKRAYRLRCAGLMMAYIVAGHHAGLPDYGNKSNIADDPTLCGYLKREAQDYSAYQAELAPPPVDEAAVFAAIARDCQTPEELSESFAFWTRYGFSCLTDADSLDTEAFCTGRAREPLAADFAECLRRVDARLAGFRCETPLQRARATLQRQAFDKALTDAEIYLMNMPTGSGKTLCGLKFALERMLRSGKKRLIYIIPYNSIIDQTAAEFEAVLGDAAPVLRHQSTYVYEEDEALAEEEKLARIRATENWDAPVIITTAVQFFSSLYGNRRNKLRRLHSLADAVLVFDEAHLLPRAYLQPCLKAIAFVVRRLRAEAVLLTATMPDYAALMERYGLRGLQTVDLVSDRRDFRLFRKCRYGLLGAVSNEALMERALSAPSCLIIVNSRRAARTLYALCPAARKYHLSTWMTARDRERVIGEVREALADLRRRYPAPEDTPPDERIMAVSTSLIEAGVDMDFHTVMRELTGLDSILQAGGRCNREGRRAMAEVYVFEREESVGRRDADARVSITRELLRTFDPIDGADCVREYYARLFAAHEDELDSRSIVNYAKERGVYDPERPFQLPFRSYAQDFQLIDAPTYAVAVPQDDQSRALIARLPYGPSLAELRALRRYTCSVSPRDFQTLARAGLIRDGGNGLYCLAREDAYNEETGILFECGDIYLD